MDVDKERCMLENYLAEVLGFYSKDRRNSGLRIKHIHHCIRLPVSVKPASDFFLEPPVRFELTSSALEAESPTMARAWWEETALAALLPWCPGEVPNLSPGTVIAGSLAGTGQACLGRDLLG